MIGNRRRKSQYTWKYDYRHIIQETIEAGAHSFQVVYRNPNDPEDLIPLHWNAPRPPPPIVLEYSHCYYKTYEGDPVGFGERDTAANLRNGFVSTNYYSWSRNAQRETVSYYAHCVKYLNQTLTTAYPCRTQPLPAHEVYDTIWSRVFP